MGPHTTTRLCKRDFGPPPPMSSELFVPWYEKIHGEGSVLALSRMQSFVTRYRARPNENALLRHIDGALVDGSLILALPTDVPFEGGGVTVWDGKPEEAHKFAMAP